MAGHTLNFFEYILENNEFNIQYFSYEKYSSKESFLKLRAENPNYDFYRERDRIYFWEKLSTQGTSLKGIPISINQKNYPKISSKIIETALIHYLYQNKNLSVRRNNYTHFWEIINHQGINQVSIPWLNVRNKITISPIYLTLANTRLFGFTVAVSQKYNFIWSQKQFQDYGIDLRNYRTNKEGNLIPNFETLSLLLEATQYSAQFNEFREKSKSLPYRFDLIKKFFSWLQEKVVSKLYLPDNGISKLFLHTLPIQQEIKIENFPAPTKLFYAGQPNIKVAPNMIQKQIEEYKPYSHDCFSQREIIIGVICPREYQGNMETFVKNLESELKKTLHLSKLIIEYKHINSSDIAEYKKGVYDEDNLRKWDLCLVIVSDNQKTLSPESSPYFYCKAKLLGLGIPTQDIRIETIKKYNLYTINNLCLNIYAKLGGTAWTIPKEDKITKEFIVGVGCTVDAGGSLVLGIAQIFHADGRYIMGDCAPLSNMEDYAQNLEEYLYNNLSSVIKNEVYNNEKFRLIFHLFKNAGAENEINAIKNLIQRLDFHNFEFALLHLGYGHNFRIYRNQGTEQIKSGTYIKLTMQQALLHLVKTSDLPLKIELDNRSTFRDIDYLAKQIFSFSYLSHKSYIPSKRTITIMYPSLMAFMIERLNKVPSWDYDRLTIMKTKLWFI